MTMTRKDFERLAAALNSSRPRDSIAYDQWHQDVEKIVGVCNHSNSLFNADRFRKAAGVEHD